LKKKFIFATTFKQIKMKKLIFGALSIVALLATQGTMAQDGGAYVKFGAGYGFATSMESRGANSTQNSITSTTSELVNYSLGKGLNFGGAFGYNFNKNIGAEVGVSYLLGGESKTENKFLNGDTRESIISAKMLQIRPTLVISAGMEKVNPYAKFGVLLSSGKITATRNNTFTGGSGQGIEEFKGGMQLGFQAGLGAEFMITEKLAFFAELNLNSLSYSPKESEITKDETRIGSVVTNNLIGDDVIDIKTVYEDSLTTSTTAPNVNEPDKALKFTIPFGSVGLNVGIKYNF
jgi:opacity protein-like surface antigen